MVLTSIRRSGLLREMSKRALDGAFIDSEGGRAILGKRNLVASPISAKKRQAAVEFTSNFVLLWVTVAAVHLFAAASHAAEVAPFEVKVSPEISQRVGVVRHSMSLNLETGTMTQSFDSRGRLVAEILADQKTTTLRRYAYTPVWFPGAKRRVVGEIVLDNESGKTLSLAAKDEKAFREWAIGYTDSVVTRASFAWTITPESMTCEEKCTARFFLEGTLGLGGLGSLIALGKYVYCLATCPPTGGGGGAMFGPQCGPRQCPRAHQTCCRGDNICLDPGRHCP
jgi:hypothetical protein